jgi:hypothetical protein
MGSRISPSEAVSESFASARQRAMLTCITIVFALAGGCGKDASVVQAPAKQQAGEGATGDKPANVSAVDGGAGSMADRSSGAGGTGGSAAHAGSSAAGHAAAASAGAGSLGHAGLSGSGGVAGPAADGGGTAADPSAPVAEIAMKLGGAVCDALAACLGPQKLSALFNREACATRIVGGLAQDDLAPLSDSIQKQRVALHAEQLAACYDDTRALGCEVQTQRLPASCQAAIAGQVAVGDVCSIGSDCAGEAFCPLTACPRVCTERNASGGTCNRDEECVSGLLCTAGTCAAPAALGAACAGSSGAVCALGASCVGSTDTKSGHCTSNAEVQADALGAACSPGGTLCQEGLSCAWDGSAAFSCQAAAGPNAACHLALPTQCPVDQYCDAKDVMTEGKCVVLPGDGQACAVSDQCAPGALCVLESSKSICRKIGDLGDACSQAGLCRSGSCTGGKCTTRPVCP